MNKQTYPFPPLDLNDNDANRFRQNDPPYAPRTGSSVRNAEPNDYYNRVRDQYASPSQPRRPADPNPRPDNPNPHKFQDLNNVLMQAPDNLNNLLEVVACLYT
jgi:hypothetical protein